MLVKHGRADAGALSRMGATLSHRGPDDSGVHLDGSVGLLQTRLSIIDLKSGHQPMVDDGLALVANGEIYNFVELRAALEARARSFATASDSEVILHAYALDGLEALRSLHGMFAFALYDARAGALVLARDRLGIKPLYYAQLPDRLLFASELKTLLAVWPNEPELAPDALVQFLHNRFNTGEASLVRGIRRVPPGTALIVDADLRVREHRYWSPLDVKPRALGFEEAAEEFEPLFRQVMHEHLRADVPYGLFLSSGVDSAVILAMVSELTGRPVRTFSLGWSDPAIGDELEGAASMARRFGADHTAIALTSSDVFRRLPHAIWAADDLLHDYAALPTSFLAERAAAEVKVVLTGEGGDEVFAGYTRYRRTAVQRWLKNVVAPGSGGFRTRPYWRHRWTRRIFGPELKAAAGAARRPFKTAWRESPRAWSDVARAQYMDMVTYLPDDLLIKTDRILMAASLEGRVPFVDHRIIEFGLALPDALKVNFRHGKLFQRRWAERYLPAAHLWRWKRGFAVPMRRWFHGALLDELAEHLSRHPAIRRWFRPEGVAALVREQQAGGNASRALWGLMQIAIWHRIFVDGLVPSRSEDPLDWIA